MTDLSADFSTLEGRGTRSGDVVDSRKRTFTSVFLSALLIIGFPAMFWMLVLEFVNYVLSLNLSGETRTVIGGVLVTLLAIIWAVITVSSRNSTRLDN